MEETITIQIKNRKALKLLQDLEDLNLITLVKEKESHPKLSEKYKNAFSRSDAESFESHVQVMRSEWNNI